ncbi:glutamate racemase, partial [Desulfobaculum sp.]
MNRSELPIGLFDSGVGGLTVLKAMRNRMPCEDLIYLGDTARLPYGTKGPDTITKYALQASARLVERGIKALVIACNTASSVALDALRAEYPDIPVLGVVEPGARARVN